MLLVLIDFAVVVLAANFFNAWYKRLKLLTVGYNNKILVIEIKIKLN